MVDKFGRHIMAESNRVGVEFLITDLTTAMTFLDLADVTASEERRTRNHEKARTAYETVLRLLPRVTPSSEERILLYEKLEQVKRRLGDKN